MSQIRQIKVRNSLDLTRLKEFAVKEILPRTEAQDEKGEFDPTLTKLMFEQGFLNAITPKEFGGPELPVSELIWIIRTLGYASAGVAATFIGNLLGYSAVVLYAPKILREKICLRYSQEFSLWSFAMTEKDCGSDLEKIATVAKKTKDGYVLNGEKNFITNGSFSTDISIFAQTIDEHGNKLGISCFYIPGNTKGLSRGPGEKKLGWRESNTGHIYLKDVVVPHTHLLGNEGEGLQILTTCLNRSKTLLGALGVGISDRALDITLDRLTTTNRFDRPLINKHSIRHVLARLSVRRECAWLLTCQAAETWDANISSTKEASMAKLHSGEVATEIIGKCVELFGARGYLSSFEIQRLYRDAKAIEIVEGPTLVQELLISKYITTQMQPVPAQQSLNDKNIKKVS